MTDLVFYAALQQCYGIDRMARQEEHRNGRQLTFEDMQTGGTDGQMDLRPVRA